MRFKYRKDKINPTLANQLLQLSLASVRDTYVPLYESDYVYTNYYTLTRLMYRKYTKKQLISFVQDSDIRGLTLYKICSELYEKEDWTDFDESRYKLDSFSYPKLTKSILIRMLIDVVDVYNFVWDIMYTEVNHG